MGNKKTKLQLLTILIAILLVAITASRTQALFQEAKVKNCSFQQNYFITLQQREQCSLSTRTAEKILVEVIAGGINPIILDSDGVQIEVEKIHPCGTLVYPVKSENNVIIENPSIDYPSEYAVETVQSPIGWTVMFEEGPFDGSLLCINCNSNCADGISRNTYTLALVFGVIGLALVWGFADTKRYAHFPSILRHYSTRIDKNLTQSLRWLIENVKIEYMLHVLLIPLVGLVVFQMHAFGLTENAQVWLIHIYSLTVVFFVFLQIVNPISVVAEWLPKFFMTSVVITLILIGISRLDWIPVKEWVFNNKDNFGFLLIYLLFLVSIEELIKLSPFLLFRRVDSSVDQGLKNITHGPRIGVFLGVVSGLGFSLVEGTFFLIEMQSQNYAVFMFRIVAGPILHAMFGGISGFYASKLLIKTSAPHYLEIIQIPLVAIALHAAYNASLFLWVLDRPYLTILGLLITSVSVINVFLKRLDVIKVNQ